MKSAESNDKEEKEVKGKAKTMEQGVTLEVIMMRLAGIIDHVHLIVFNLHHSPHKVNRCLARYSPRATTTNRPTTGH